MNVENETIDLEEGKLYVYKNGELEEIKTEPNDLPKIRILERAFQALLELQDTLKKMFFGYRIDKTLLASALIIVACQIEGIEEKIKEFLRETFE